MAQELKITSVEKPEEKFETLETLIDSIKKDKNCLDDIKINNRKISKTCVKNIFIFLLNESE